MSYPPEGITNIDDALRDRIQFLRQAELITDTLAHHKSGYNLQQRCPACILNSAAIPLEEDRPCELCRSAESRTDKSASTDSQHLARELDTLLNAHCGAGAGEFDALLMFSGGKDSTYLLHQLQSRYPNLRLFAIMVDNGFSSPAALVNAHLILERSGVKHRIVRPPFNLVKDLFQHCLINYNLRGGYLTVDRADGELIFDVARNIATRQRIPLIIAGISPAQCREILQVNSFELPSDHMTFDRTHVAGFDMDDIYSVIDRSCWWQHSDHSRTELPRIIVPFFAWDYDEKTVARKGAALLNLKKQYLHPIITNHDLIFVTFALDYTRLGYSTFEIEFAKSIRRGEAPRSEWLKIFQTVEYTVPRGEFFPELIANSLERLGLTQEQLGLPDAATEDPRPFRLAN